MHEANESRPLLVHNFEFYIYKICFGLSLYNLRNFKLYQYSKAIMTVFKRYLAKFKENGCSQLFRLQNRHLNILDYINYLIPVLRRKKLCNFGHLLIKFEIDKQNI